MKVSILMTTKNAEGHIVNCLNSIIEQKFNNDYEIVIVDRGSDDNTVNVIDNYNNMFMSEEMRKKEQLTDEQNDDLNLEIKQPELENESVQEEHLDVQELNEDENNIEILADENNALNEVKTLENEELEETINAEDDDEEIIESKIKLLNFDVDNCADALNYGLKNCSGEYILKIEVNNEFNDDLFNDMFNFLENNEAYNICNSCVNVNNVLMNFKVNHNNEELTHKMLINEYPCLHYCYMFKKDMNIEYDNNYSNIMDYKLLLDLTRDGKRIWCLGHDLVKYNNFEKLFMDENIKDAIELRKQYQISIFDLFNLKK